MQYASGIYYSTNVTLICSQQWFSFIILPRWTMEVNDLENTELGVVVFCVATGGYCRSRHSLSETLTSPQGLRSVSLGCKYPHWSYEGSKKMHIHTQSTGHEAFMCSRRSGLRKVTLQFLTGTLESISQHITNLHLFKHDTPVIPNQFFLQQSVPI